MARVLRFIWSIYSLIIFIVTLLIVTPLYLLIFLLMGQKGGNVAHSLSQKWAKTLVVLCLIRVKVHNKKVLDKNKSYVFVANHNSQLDIPVCALATNHFMKYLAKEELTKIPLLGYIIKNIYITVSRQSRDDRARSLEKMKNAIKSGVSVMVYPEGTRNRTDEPLKPFYDGAFKTAINAQGEIAVLTIVGSKNLLPIKPNFYMAPGTIHCYWDKPIKTEGLTFKDIPRLKQEVHDLMLSHLERHN